MPTWDLFLRHPLLVAAVQLLVGAGVAYWFAERWQRWRQQRDFQYQAMVKFNELAHEVAERMRELLLYREGIGTKIPPDSFTDTMRTFVSRWTALEAMRDELVAIFAGDTIREFDELLKTLKNLRHITSIPFGTAPKPRAIFQPILDRFLFERQITSIDMMRDMGFRSAQYAARVAKTLNAGKGPRAAE